MIYTKKHSIHSDQKGMVSIIVTLIIMIVLTLIVTGFAQLARREQRETLDRQLNNQAFYAAESGINAVRLLLDQYDLQTKTDCNPDIAHYPGLPVLPGEVRFDNLSGDNNVRYTCILFDKEPKNLQYDAVEPSRAKIIPIVPVNSDTPPVAVNITDLTINWENSADTEQTIPESSVYPNFSSASDWNDTNNYTTALRVELVPADIISSASLTNSAYTFFAYPSDDATAGTADYYPLLPDLDQQGKVLKANCTATSTVSKCKITITGLGAIGSPGRANRYYLRIKPIYKSADINICVPETSAGSCSNSTTKLSDAQVLIDSTGKANDVLKRIQVRVPDASNKLNATIKPEFAIESGENICKKFSVWPGGGDMSTCPL